MARKKQTARVSNVEESRKRSIKQVESAESPTPKKQCTSEPTSLNVKLIKSFSEVIVNWISCQVVSRRSLLYFYKVLLLTKDWVLKNLTAEMVHEDNVDNLFDNPLEAIYDLIPKSDEKDYMIDHVLVDTCGYMYQEEEMIELMKAILPEDMPEHYRTFLCRFCLSIQTHCAKPAEPARFNDEKLFCMSPSVLYDGEQMLIDSPLFKEAYEWAMSQTSIPSRDVLLGEQYTELYDDLGIDKDEESDDEGMNEKAIKVVHEERIIQNKFEKRLASFGITEKQFREACKSMERRRDLPPDMANLIKNRGYFPKIQTAHIFFGYFYKCEIQELYRNFSTRKNLAETLKKLFLENRGEMAIEPTFLEQLGTTMKDSALDLKTVVDLIGEFARPISFEDLTSADFTTEIKITSKRRTFHSWDKLCPQRKEEIFVCVEEGEWEDMSHGDGKYDRVSTNDEGMTFSNDYELRFFDEGVPFLFTSHSQYYGDGDYGVYVTRNKHGRVIPMTSFRADRSVYTFNEKFKTLLAPLLALQDGKTSKFISALQKNGHYFPQHQSDSD